MEEVSEMITVTLFSKIDRLDLVASLFLKERIELKGRDSAGRLFDFLFTVRSLSRNGNRVDFSGMASTGKGEVVVSGIRYDFGDSDTVLIPEEECGRLILREEGDV